MGLRSNGPLAGFGWLKRAINLGHRNAKAVFGAAALLCVAVLLPSLITLPMQLGSLYGGTPPSATTMGLVMVVSVLAGLLLVPLYAGYLRVIDAVERGQPVRARAVFAPYRQGEVLHLVGYGVAMLVVYFALFAAVLLATGSGLLSWYMQVLALQASGGQPAAVPALPSGFGLTLFLLGALCLWLMGVYAISLGQVALRGRSMVGAIGDGVVGSLKNLLPLLVFCVSLAVAWIIAGIVVGLAMVVVALLGKLVGMWLTVLLAIPLYLALILAMVVVMFGAMYYLWRDVCGDDAASPMAEAVAA